MKRNIKLLCESLDKEVHEIRGKRHISTSPGEKEHYEKWASLGRRTTLLDFTLNEVSCRLLFFVVLRYVPEIPFFCTLEEAMLTKCANRDP